jgi:hypothetical protein
MFVKCIFKDECLRFQAHDSNDIYEMRRRDRKNKNHCQFSLLFTIRFIIFIKIFQ